MDLNVVTLPSLQRTTHAVISTAKKPAMSTRESKKKQTRQALMNAALELVGRGDNFASISLREVAKNAGVVPTSFYRHFETMEDLGLSLVDELGMMLRRLMRSARQAGQSLNDQIKASVAVYVQHVLDNRNLFLFMVQCRSGGTPALRDAIRNELRYFVNELVVDINRADFLPNVSHEDLEMIVSLIINTVAETTLDILDLPTASRSQRARIEALTVKQIRLIFLGALAWRSLKP